MASKVILKENSGLGNDLYTILSDTFEDLEEVNTDELSVGSIALCLETKKRYILSVAKIWKEIQK
jgi:hypothetical protein